MSALTRRLRPLAALSMAALFLLTAFVPALAASGKDGKATPWEEMEYEHYDPAPFHAKLEDFSAAAEDADAGTAIALYDELYEEFIRVYTYDCLALVYNNQDVNDKHWADELVYCNTLVTELADAFAIACHDVLEGPCGEDFAAHVGENATQEFQEYEPMSARELELTEQETELINEYTALMDKENETVYTYEGEEWTLDRLDGEDGAALSDGAYHEIAYGIYDVLAQDAADIFAKLVAIRTEQAQINGYDDYNHYAYEELRNRDYTPEQAQTLFAEIREISRQIFASDVLYMTDQIAPSYDDPEDMLAVLHEYTAKVDPVFDETWQFMMENHLCDISVGSGRAAGSYTIELPAYSSSFIYSDDVGSCYALSTLFHEFGHYTACQLTSAENYLTSWRSLDLAEIHSTGMELLVLPFYDEIFQQGADIARYCDLYSALTTVTDQALFAEFEEQIYADPEAYATAEALGKLYNDISVEYGYSDLGYDPTWIYITHFFDSPNYVVSYVAATLAAIQIWSVSQEDWQEGVDVYMDIVRQGPYDLNYFDVLEAAGLKGFDTEGVATEVCGQVLDAMAALESKILYGEEAPAEEDAGDVLDGDPPAAAEEDAPAETSADVLDVETQGMASAADGGTKEPDTDVLG